MYDGDINQFMEVKAVTRRLSVLLVEDDERACNEFVQNTDELDDVELVAITDNSRKAIEYVLDLLPDAVILDLELHQGGGNGLVFLQELGRMDLPVRPYVLITTNNTSLITYEYARQAGADFIMAKHQSDYSVKGAVDFLRMMKSVIQSRSGRTEPAHATTESPEQREKRITRRINLELDYVGISPKAVGYKYLSDAIALIISKPEKNLCATIGSQYGKTDSSVERAMQNAINKAWRTTDIDDLAKHYTARICSDKGVPTITEFIYYYANKIKNEY